MKNKKKEVSVILYNPWLVFIALIDFLFLEFSCERLVDDLNKGLILWPYNCICHNVFFVIGFLFLLSVLGLGWFQHKYKLSSSTLRQLISNALGYKWLTLFILFFFMMHFSWAIDAGFDIFIKAEFNNDNWVGQLFYVIIPVIGMFVAALIIPVKENAKKPLSEAKILISAISVSIGQDKDFMLLPRNLDLFFKPFIKGVSYTDSDNPPVALNGIEKVIVIPSRSLLECKISSENDKWIELKNKIPQKFAPDEDKLKSLSATEKVENQSKMITPEEMLKNTINQYNEESTFGNMIKFLSCFMNVEFIFPTDSVDYDKFDQVFSVAADLLKKHEKNTDDKTLIHISPGTAIPAGALTALGIKKNRSILYTGQNGKNEDKVSSVEIDVDSMDDWLSELMEEKDDREK